MLRKGTDESVVNGVYEQLKTQLGNMSDGSVSETQLDGAMRLYPNNDKVDSYHDRELQRLVHQGVQKLRLVAGHGQIRDSGQVRRERIDIAQIPKDKDNCGGLADVVEVSTCMCKHHIVNPGKNMSLAMLTKANRQVPHTFTSCTTAARWRGSTCVAGSMFSILGYCAAGHSEEQVRCSSFRVVPYRALLSATVQRFASTN